MENKKMNKEINKELAKVCEMLADHTKTTPKMRKDFLKYAKIFKCLGKKLKPIHKKHANERKTICGIKYDNTIMHKFIPNQLAGHWRRVTCKNCLRFKPKKTKK